MTLPQIYAAIKNQQSNHQAFVVEMEGILVNHPISILIDPSSNLSYIAPQVVEACVL